MNGKFSNIIQLLQSNAALLKSKKITAGFDGFVDTIVRIIKYKTENDEQELFNTIGEFGAYITEKSGSSFSLELEEISVKAGGNMPITANALASLGAQVNCVGALGFPHTHKVFLNLAAKSKCFSFAEPGTATAYEFNDGKIFLAHMKALNELKWDAIKSTLGIDVLIELFTTSDLFCMLNWSEIDASTDIWKGVLKDVMPHCKGNNRIAFFDLSDCSKRTDEYILEMLSLLKEFGKYAKVILSLNRNETNCISKVLLGKSTTDFETQCLHLFERLNVDILLLHSSKKATAYFASGKAEAESFYISNPVFSTGAGDNFNAGFIASQLMELDFESSLIVANAAAAIHIQTGNSAGIESIVQFLETQK